jgi:hypothetical protein
VDRVSLGHGGKVITCSGFDVRHAASGSGKTWGKLLTYIHI